MEVAAAGLVDSSRPIAGRPAGTSLAALGYASVGMDEGWAACTPQPGFPTGDWVFHRSNPDGSISPVVNTSQFPDLKGLVSRIHAMNLSVGWYLNDCFSYCWQLCVGDGRLASWERAAGLTPYKTHTRAQGRDALRGPVQRRGRDCCLGLRVRLGKDRRLR
jgi:hypothetical protein